MLSSPHAFFWFKWPSSLEMPALATRMEGILGNGDGFAGDTFQRFSRVKTELNWVFNISALLRGVVRTRSPDARVLTLQESFHVPFRDLQSPLLLLSSVSMVLR